MVHPEPLCGALMYVFKNHMNGEAGDDNRKRLLFI